MKLEINIKGPCYRVKCFVHSRFPKNFVSVFGMLHEEVLLSRTNIDSFFPVQEAGMKVTPMCDITTEHEKKLGLLVREKYVNHTAFV